MFIFDSNRFARERTALPTEVEGVIKANGGEVLVSRLWEERRLAYPIAGHRKGTSSRFLRQKNNPPAPASPSQTSMAVGSGSSPSSTTPALAIPAIVATSKHETRAVNRIEGFMR
jgi:hypothetical protein